MGVLDGKQQSLASLPVLDAVQPLPQMGCDTRQVSLTVHRYVVRTRVSQQLMIIITRKGGNCKALQLEGRPSSHQSF